MGPIPSLSRARQQAGYDADDRSIRLVPFATPFFRRSRFRSCTLGQHRIPRSLTNILHLGCKSLRETSVALVIVKAFATFSFPSRRLCRRFRNDSEAVGLGKVCVETNDHRWMLQPMLHQCLAPKMQ